MLTLYPDKTVAIVESEKSALIASAVTPYSIWIAAGQLNGLSIEKCHVLKGRYVTLFPDLGGFEKWSIKATEIQKQCECEISISTLLEEDASYSDRANGLDIADFIIAELLSEKSIPEIQSRFTHELQSMIDKNPALLVLVNRLKLESV